MSDFVRDTRTGRYYYAPENSDTFWELHKVMGLTIERISTRDALSMLNGYARGTK